MGKLTEYIERPSTTSDSKWIWETYKSLLNETINKQWGWDEAFQHDRFHSTYDLKQYKIIEFNEISVAAYYLVEDIDHLHLRMLLVLEPYQRIGIGSKIVERIKSSAQTKNKSIKLSVIESNPALSFYQKRGFHRVRARDGFHTLEWLR